MTNKTNVVKQLDWTTCDVREISQWPHPDISLPYNIGESNVPREACGSLDSLRHFLEFRSFDRNTRIPVIARNVVLELIANNKLSDINSATLSGDFDKCFMGVYHAYYIRSQIQYFIIETQGLVDDPEQRLINPLAWEMYDFLCVQKNQLARYWNSVVNSAQVKQALVAKLMENIRPLASAWKNFLDGFIY